MKTFDAAEMLAIIRLKSHCQSVASSLWCQNSIVEGFTPVCGVKTISQWDKFNKQISKSMQSKSRVVVSVQLWNSSTVSCQFQLLPRLLHPARVEHSTFAERRGPGTAQPPVAGVAPSKRRDEYLCQWQDQPGGVAFASYWLSVRHDSRSFSRKWSEVSAPARQSSTRHYNQPNTTFWKTSALILSCRPMPAVHLVTMLPWPLTSRSVSAMQYVSTKPFPY